MEETGQHQLMSTRFLKNVTQLLVSVSVFSYLFSQSYFLTYLHSYNFYFSTFPYQLINHTIDKNYMFLLCNGLLVFLVKYSGIFMSLSLSNRHQDDQFFRNIMIDGSSPSQNSMPHTKESILHNKAAVESVASDIEEEKENDEYLNHEIEEQIMAEDEEESGIYNTNISKEEEEEEEEDVVEDVVEYDEEEQYWSNGDTLFGERMVIEEDKFEFEEEEENGKLSTEELNKKFDDFIRKMKQELRIEAKRQLIMV